MAASTAVVTIAARSFPSGFDWKKAAEELKRRPLAEIPAGLEAGLGETIRPAQLAAGLNYAGTLVLAESVGLVNPIPGMVVLKVEAEQLDDTGGVALVSLTLADERLFSSRGFLRRWRWNTILPDGSKSKDTLKEDGEPYALAEAAKEVTSGLWRKPNLNRVPSSWLSDFRAITLQPFAAPGPSLEVLTALGGAADPCLHLDGEFAIYKVGEGFLGYAPEGKGENRIPFPAGVILEEDGAGVGHTEEANFPPEFVVVVGQERVATVALDEWEPVLVINGTPWLLSEELVRYLTGGKLEEQTVPGKANVTTRKVTGGKHGLEWLKSWVMLPNTSLGANGVTEDVLKLLAAQAWIFYRMPGVEKQEGGFYTGEPGRNAHLLPMLDRAETRAGKRMPPTIYASSWEAKRRELQTTAEFSRLRTANDKLQAIKQQVFNSFASRGVKVQNPLEGSGAKTTGGVTGPSALRQLDSLTLTDMSGGELLPYGVDANSLNSALRHYRKVNGLRELGFNELAAEYEKAFEEKIKAQDGISYGELSSVYATAKKLAEFERQAFETGSAKENFRRQFGKLVDEELKRLGEKQRVSRRKGQADREAGRPKGKLLSYTFLRNNRRGPDGGGRIESRAAGIVRTSKRAGHAKAPDRNDPSLTSFVPRAVRVLFGAVVRPRIDAPVAAQRLEGPTGAVPTGEVSAALSLIEEFQKTVGAGFGDFVPKALSDEATTYTAAFKRLGPNVVAPVDLSTVPSDQAQTVRRPWRELIPLEGLGNKAELDAQAAEVAKGIASPQDRTKSASYTLAGAWPVQCDGLISAVEIVMEQQDGAPCGFTTRLSVGGEATIPAQGTESNRRVPDYVRGD